MSRAFHPPDTLSKDDVRKIADVRRDVWTSGFKGLFYGSAAGYGMHTAGRIVHDRILPDDTKARIRTIFNMSKKQPLFSRNTAFLSFLAGGAFGSFIMATTTGKNEVHELHDIFHINEKKKETNTKYQQIVEGAQRDSVDDGIGAIQVNDMEENSDTRKKRRLSRRRTVADRLAKGRGLSDSHGGHWLDEEEEMSMTQKQRSLRRRTMTKRLEEGKGLSDSHSGKWES